jgi:hypothetical protein
MLSTKFFPVLLIVMDVLAAIGYCQHGFQEWRKVIYWLSAATLTYVVTF